MADETVTAEMIQNLVMPEQPAAPLNTPPPRRGAGGRPKGSRNKPKREALRPDMHEPVHEPLRTRKTNVGGRFHIPPEIIAKYLPGRSVEWKRHTLIGQEDPFYQMSLREVGWEPVQSYQLPGLMPFGYKGAIVRDGMMLYERPQELTDQARAEQEREAFEVIRNTERRLGIAGPGEMTRDHPEVQPRINKTYEPLVIRKAQ